MLMIKKGDQKVIPGNNKRKWMVAREAMIAYQTGNYEHLYDFKLLLEDGTLRKYYFLSPA